MIKGWFDPSDEVVIRPEVDRTRFWRRRFGQEQVEIAPQVLFVNNGHGRLFDTVCDLLDRQATIFHDFRTAGYCHYRLHNEAYLTVYQAPEPAPYAAHALEHVISAGARQIVFINGSGSLREDLPLGSLLLPDELVREEGTSFHYAPGEVRLRTNTNLNGQITLAAEKVGTPLVVGKHWTTDAIYRETWTKIDQYRAAGVNSVDMELSALAGVAYYRQSALSAVLVVTDVCTRSHSWKGVSSDLFQQGVRAAAAVAVSVFQQPMVKG